MLRYLALLAIVGSIACLSIGLLLENPAARAFLVVYTAPFFGVVAAWIWLEASEQGPKDRWVAVLDIVVVLLAGIRMVTDAIPLSGHMLFLVYAGLVKRSLVLRAAVALDLVIVTYFKLVAWQDVRTWALGGAAGIFAALIHTQLVSRKDDVPA